MVDKQFLKFHSKQGRVIGVMNQATSRLAVGEKAKKRGQIGKIPVREAILIKYIHINYDLTYIIIK